MSNIVPWAAQNERAVGRGHATLQDVVNRPLRWMLSILGLDPDAQFIGFETVFNVKAFGAKGDGVTDDRAAVQAAIDAALAVGGKVWFPTPAVSYYLNSFYPSQTTNILYATTNYTGLARRIILEGAPGAVITTPLSYNVAGQAVVTLLLEGDLIESRVRNIEFKNTHAVTAGRTQAIVTAGGANNVIKRLKIEKCVFWNHSRTIVVNGVEGITIDDNDFLFTNGRDSGSTSLPDPGVAIWSFVQANGQASDVRITRNRYDGCTSGNVSTNTNKSGQDGFVYGMARSWVITGNQIKRFGYEGIYVGSRQGYETTIDGSVVISGNTIDSTPITGETPDTRYSIRCDEHNATITGNTLIGTQRGIWVSGVALAGNVTGSTIVGNTIRLLDSTLGNVFQGVYTANVSDFLVASNKVLGNTVTTSGTDIQGFMLASSQRVQYNGNVVRVATKPGGKTLNGFWFENTGIADVTLEDNTTDNCHNDLWSAASNVAADAVRIGRHTSFRSTNYINASGTLGTFNNVSAQSDVRIEYPGINGSTLTPRVKKPVQHITGVLAANQTYTLSRTGAIHGDYFRIVNRASGAFTVTVQDATGPTTLKTIPVSTQAFVEAVFDRSFGWQLHGYGTL